MEARYSSASIKRGNEINQLGTPVIRDAYFFVVGAQSHSVRDRVFFLLASFVFVAAFCWNYMKFQVVALGWSNIYYTPTPLSAWLAGFGIFLIVGLFFSAELKRPSSFAVLMQYALVLMPVCFVPMFRREMPLDHCILLSLTFALAVLILVIMNGLPRKVLPISRLRPDIAWSLFAGFYVILNLIVALAGPRWQLVSFNDVYDVVRQQALQYTGTLFTYCYMNLAWGANPFLLAYAMGKKNYWMVAFASAMEMYLYGYGGFKSALFVPPLVIGTYLLVSRLHQVATKILLLFGASIVISTAAYLQSPSPLNFAINSLYEMRTIGMAGQNAAGFDYFAYNHGFTYWSHLKGVNMFIHYDFKQDIGNEVGLMEQGYTTQANTGFLATDGLSAFGLAGVLIIPFIVGGYFWLVDCAASAQDSAFAIAAFAVPAFILVNNGFFTSLLSDGALLIVVLLQLMPSIPHGAESVSAEGNLRFASPSHG